MQPSARLFACGLAAFIGLCPAALADPLAGIGGGNTVTPFTQIRLGTTRDVAFKVPLASDYLLRSISVYLSGAAAAGSSPQFTLHLGASGPGPAVATFSMASVPDPFLTNQSVIFVFPSAVRVRAGETFWIRGTDPGSVGFGWRDISAAGIGIPYGPARFVAHRLNGTANNDYPDIVVEGGSILTSNLESASTGGTVFPGVVTKAMGFTMPAGPSHRIKSVALNVDITSGSPVVELWTGAAQPTTRIATLPAIVGGVTGPLELPFFAPNVVLMPGVRYFIVVSNGGSATFEWRATSATPTGPAASSPTSLTYLTDFGSGYVSSTTRNELAITTAPVIISNLQAAQTTLTVFSGPPLDEKDANFDMPLGGDFIVNAAQVNINLPAAANGVLELFGPFTPPITYNTEVLDLFGDINGVREVMTGGKARLRGGTRYTVRMTNQAGANFAWYAAATQPTGVATSAGYTFAENGGAPINSSTFNQYQVTALPTYCAGDYNLSGGISVEDIFTFLQDYFSGSRRSNVNEDASYAVIGDLFSFLALYFQGC